MLKTCPQCGSNEIYSDLVVFADQPPKVPVYVRVIEPQPPRPPFLWTPKDVSVGFRAAICVACGHTGFYVKDPASLLTAYKQGWQTDLPPLDIIPY